MSATKRLDTSSEVFVLNATEMPVDVFVNDETQPSISDPRPLVAESANADELAPTVLVVDGKQSRPYGAYSFSVQNKGDPGGAVLAAASIALEQGRSFSGVFHPRPDGGYQFSVYENDLSPAGNARLTVRHSARHEAVSWTLEPNGENPGGPPDTRSGTLQCAQWQIARDVTDNDYALEFFAGGELVARHPDLDLAAHKNIIAYLIGDPQPATDPQKLLRPVVYQELEVDPGPAGESVTTPPAPPMATADENAPVEFTCEPVTVWQTHAASTRVSAVDPDGSVTNLSLDRVEPPTDGVNVDPETVRQSPATGEPASAEIRFGSDIPAGTYQVWITANEGSLAQQASNALELTVKPITIARITGRVTHYEEIGDIEDGLAAELRNLLDRAHQHQGSGDTGAACADLKNLLGVLGADKGKRVTDRAHDDVTTETKSLRSNLEC